MLEKDGSTGRSLPVNGSFHGSSGSLSHLTQKPYVTNRNTKQQFKALMKKNYILKSRGCLCCCTGTEIILPVLFFVMMVAPKALVSIETYNDKFFDPYYPAVTNQEFTRDIGWKLNYAPNTTFNKNVTVDAMRHLFCDFPAQGATEDFQGSYLANQLNWIVQAGSIPDSFDVFDLSNRAGLPTEASFFSAVKTCLGPDYEFYDERLNSNQTGADLPAINDEEFLADLCSPTTCGDEGYTTNRAKCDCIFQDFIQGFETQEDAIESALRTENQWSVLGTINYESVDSDDVQYRLRVNGTGFREYPEYESFTKLFTELWDSVTTNSYWKLWGTFSTIRNAIDEALITIKWSPRTPVRIETSVKHFPWLSYKENVGGAIASAFFSLILVFAYTTTSTIVLKTIVAEKELRLREGMQMMGMGNPVYWSSWFLTHWSSLVLSMFISALIGLYPFEYTNFAIMFLFLITWGASLVTFCYFISCFFDRSLIASIVGSLLYVCGLAPAIAVAIKQPYGGFGWKLISLFPAGSIYAWGDILAVWENGQQGITGSTFGLSIHNKAHYSAATCFGLTFFDIFLYAGLTWYFDKVWPSKITGVKEKPWFLFTPSYWKADSTEPITPVGAEDPEDGSEMKNLNIQQMDPAMEANAAVKVIGLGKTFGEVRAVNKLSFTFAKNEISCLLGHNGAGKTTTISMLTGGLAPDEGRALIDGMDIRTDMDAIRKSLGVCPQFDILWPELTVKEHMRLYATFTGIPPQYVDQEMTELLHEVGLEEKTDSFVSSLSGGQKRKLSLSIAFLGNPKVVFLDEPTSGMDPYSRRMSWEVIRKMRAGRAIILTTHFMDEADILSDRVAIMSAGHLAAMGSSTFLKSRFGLGYLLTMEKKNESQSADGADDLIRGHIPKAVQATHVGTELSYKLPHQDSDKFADMLEELEAQQKQLGLMSYGLSNTTLEEVFLAIAKGKGVGPSHADKKTKKAHEENLNKLLTDRSARAKPFISGFPLKVQQFRALLTKRVINVQRDKLAIFVQLIAPVLFVIVAMAIGRIKFGGNSGDYPAVTVDRSLVSNKPFPYGDSSGTLDLTVYASVGTNLAQSGRSRLANKECFCPSKDQNAALSKNCTSVKAGEKSSITPECEPFFMQTLDEFLLDQQEYGTACSSEKYCDAMFVNDYDVAARRFNHTLMVNPTSYFAMTTAMGAANNLIYRAVSGGKGSITVINQPMPDPPKQPDTEPDFIQDLVVSIFIGLGLAILSASFSSFLVAERMNNAKHLQMVSGVDKISFWVSSFVADYVTYLIPAAAVMVVIVAFDQNAYVSGDSPAAIFILLLLFGWAAIPLSYVLHFPFRMPMNSLVLQMALYISLTLGSLITAVVFDELTSASSKNIDSVLEWVFRFIPHYCVTRGIYQVAQQRRIEALGNQFDFDPSTRDVYHVMVTGYHMLFLFFEGVFFFALTIFIEINEQNVLSKGVAAAREAGEDEDVMAEEERVQRLADEQATSNKAVVLVKGLAKTYRNNFAAVRPLSFGVGRGQCFGLLGINGAGKTSTFRMLTGEFVPSAGDATIQGRADASGAHPLLSIVNDISNARKLIGYCPQFDGIQPNMTGREHLWFYGRVRGVPTDEIEETVNALLDRMDLNLYADRLAGSYSGGNKRKLSVAIALVGDPPVVLLDEPSTGMDPEARRFMWDVISTSMQVSNPKP